MIEEFYIFLLSITKTKHMKKYSILLTLLILTLVFQSPTLSAQTTTIAYSNVVGTSSSCYFSSGPKTISGYLHEKRRGDVTMVSKGLTLFSDGWNSKNSNYYINYSFVAGYNYEVKVSASTQNSCLLKGGVFPYKVGNDNTCPLSQSISDPYNAVYTGSYYPSFSMGTNTLLSFSMPAGSTAIPYLVIGAEQGNAGPASPASELLVNSIMIIKTAISCTLPAPTGLNPYFIQNNFVAIEWNQVPNATSYTFDYKLTSSNTWTNVQLNNPTSTSVQIGGLANGTAYDYRVRANCATNSGPYASSQFSTLCFLANVTNLNGTAVSGGSNSSTITWTYPANPNGPTVPISFNLEFKESTSSTWNVIIVPNNNPSPDPANIASNHQYFLVALSNAATYDLRVRANCQTGSGNYVTTQIGNTSCTEPTNLNTEPYNDFALLQWDRMPQASSYDVQVDFDVNGSHNWVTVASGINPSGPIPPSFIVNGLSPSTAYAWKVRDLCANSVYSNYTTPINFITLPSCNAVISNISTAVITSHSVILSWDNSNSNATSRIQYKIIGASNWTCFNQCLTNTSPVVVNGLSPSTTYIIRVMPFCGYTQGGPYGEGTPQQVQITTQSNFTAANTFLVENQNFNIVETSSAKTDDNNAKDEKNAEKQIIDYSVYPLPAINNFAISFKEPIVKLTIIKLLDSYGAVVYSRKINSGKTRIEVDVTQMKSGLYFLVVSSENTKGTRKIIIQH